ncbi:MAG: hypothetical protein ACR652_08115 [Methylocystis sp.]|uniref:hypothetical protein n=1 Tax=Methylocystis sp. TaxID=1911079 RepID=UPI003DA4711B
MMSRGRSLAALMADVLDLKLLIGVGDETTAKYCSDEIGKHYVRRERWGTSVGGGGWKLEPLLPPEALRRLDGKKRLDPSSATNAKPFGDAAIRALFNDANDLGTFIKTNANPAFGLRRGRSDAAKALAEIIVQYAGDLGLQKSTSIEAAKSGVLQFLDQDRTLKATLDPNDWQGTFNKNGGSAGGEKILGVQDLTAALGDIVRNDGDASSFSVEIDNALKKWDAQYNAVSSATRARRRQGVLVDSGLWQDSLPG